VLTNLSQMTMNDGMHQADQHAKGLHIEIELAETIQERSKLAEITEKHSEPTENDVRRMFETLNQDIENARRYRDETKQYRAEAKRFHEAAKQCYLETISQELEMRKQTLQATAERDLERKLAATEQGLEQMFEVLKQEIQEAKQHREEAKQDREEAKRCYMDTLSRELEARKQVPKPDLERDLERKLEATGKGLCQSINLLEERLQALEDMIVHWRP
jgi:hypothetical protein